MFEVEVSIDLVAIEAAQDRVAAWLEAEKAGAALAYRVRLVLDELLANLVMHARFPGGAAPARIAVRLAGGTAEVTIEDRAEPFDPRATPDPALPPSLDDDRIGGMGLALVRRMATISSYGRRADGWNVTKLLVASSSPD